MQNEFVTRPLAERPDALAPDGSEVRFLAVTRSGSMAEFRLPAGQLSVAICHRSVDELWYFTGGKGRLWRKSETAEETVAVHAGVSISIPVGTRFQFRNDGDVPLIAIGVTMPPWPGMDEAFVVRGIWPLPG